MNLHSAQEIIDDIKAGKMVILMDDEDRENEGDLIIVAEHISAEAINESGSNETALSSNKTSTYITHGIVGSTVSYSTKVGSYKGTNSINLNAKIPLGKQPHQRLELHEAHWNTFSAPNDLEMKFGFDSSFTLNSIINFELTAEKKLSGNRDFTFELQLKAGF